jgi:glycosyltransferase involved in cell wall biosynthesis
MFMQSSLIFSPSLDGHRQIHAFVYSRILKELGYRITIAFNFEEKTSNDFYIELLKKDKNVSFIDTNVYSKNGYEFSQRQFIELQTKCLANLTIFAEADNHISLFNSQLFNKRKLRGKTIGLFFRPFHIYKKKSIWEILRYIKQLRLNWKSDGLLFHEYLLKRFKLLDTALYIDEKFTSSHSFGCLIPDIFQKYAETLIEDENPEQRVWIDRLNGFIEQNNDNLVFFYFGTAAKRRGYDELLKMAIKYDGCFVHCGSNHPVEDYDNLKNILLNRNRLFFTNQYISDPKCIEYFFKSVKYLILPYQDFLGSSGVMFQALCYGLPVVVPDYGLMGYLVKKYNLGRTYESGNPSSLMKVFDEFKESPFNFEENIKNYMNSQSTDNFKKVLVNAFTQEQGRVSNT